MERLGYIELGRGIAASLVLLHHVEVVLAKYFPSPFSGSLFDFGARGVDFFFVLSGFIIYLAHLSELDKPEALRSYVLKRIIRLYPLLWLIAVPFGLFGLYLKQFTLSEVLSTWILYPSLDTPRPGVIWTLRHELLFYFLFAFLIYSYRLGVLVFSSYLMLVIISSSSGFFSGTVFSMVFSAYGIQFLAGMAAAIVFIYLRDSDVSKEFCFLCVCMFPLTLLIGEYSGAYKSSGIDYESHAANFWVFVFSVPTAISVLGLALTSLGTRSSRAFYIFGGMSYALYLVHLPLVSMAAKFASLLLPSTVLGYLFTVILSTLLSLLISYLLYTYFDKPVNRFLKNKLL